MVDYRDRSEEELLSLMCKEDDHVAFTEIYARFSEFLLVYGYKVTQDTSESQDIVQNIFINLWSKRKNLQIKGPLSHYLIQSVRFGFLKAVRSKQTFASYEADLREFLAVHSGAADEYILEKELITKLMLLADSFPETMGKVFILSFFDQMTPQEIADHLKISERTVRNLMSESSKRAKLNLGLAISVLVAVIN